MVPLKLPAKCNCPNAARLGVVTAFTGGAIAVKSLYAICNFPSGKMDNRIIHIRQTFHRETAGGIHIGAAAYK